MYKIKEELLKNPTYFQILWLFFVLGHGYIPMLWIDLQEFLHIDVSDFIKYIY